ncbi:MAG TPA: cytochrome c [Vicinamibacterales bacterium]|nr:cytochrome c [Vicinamibacterales bacterium]
MTTRILAATLVVGVSLCAVAARAVQAQANVTPQYQPFPTIWGGVYTAAQADRGQPTAARLCGRCHGPELRGTDKAPRLTGSRFFERWDNLRLLDIVAYIQGAMPREHEFFVSGDDARDITGFMLRESGVPAGTEPVSKDVNVLSQILVTRTRGK